MREQFSKLAQTIVSINALWVFISPLAKLFYLLQVKRNNHEQSVLVKNSEAWNSLKNLKILHGPFQAMTYPKADAIGGLPYAKLMGSYEAELHPTIESIISEDYRQVIDVGCAEGYYAVGLAMRLKNSQVIAFDIDPKARALCSKMAQINGVSDRVEIRQACTAETLIKMNFDNKSLIISDCESYELELFSKETIENLRTTDVLIGTHDFMNLEISKELERRFSQTHKVHRIQSIDDIEKARTYSYPESANMNLLEKKALFAEGRPSIMEWLWCEVIN